MNPIVPRQEQEEEPGDNSSPSVCPRCMEPLPQIPSIHCACLTASSKISDSLYRQDTTTGDSSANESPLHSLAALLTSIYAYVLDPVRVGCLWVAKMWAQWSLMGASLYTTACFQCLRWCLGFYHSVRICFGVSCLLVIHWIGRIGILRPSKCIARFLFGGAKGRAKIALHRRLAEAETYDQWISISAELDELTGANAWCEDDSIENSPCDTVGLRSHTAAMCAARLTSNFGELAFLLRVCCHRNFCGLRNPALYAYSFIRTKEVVECFYTEVCASLDALAANVIEDPLDEDPSPTPPDMDEVAMDARQRLAHLDTPLAHSVFSHDGYYSDSSESHRLTRSEFLRLLSDLRLSMGRAALCLSGGGGLAISHMGVIKILMEQNLMPTIVSGSSGGSLIASLLACKTDSQFTKEFFREDFLQERHVRLCPKLFDQICNVWKNGCMLDHDEFENLARTLLGDVTFAEAFARTNRFVSITTTPAGSTGYGEPLICNVVNTPDMLIWSAVVASCSLPLVLPPAILYIKRPLLLRSPLRCCVSSQKRHRGPDGCHQRLRSSPSMETATEEKALSGWSFSSSASTDRVAETEIRNYAPLNMRFVDGSILQDIPHTEMQTLFNVKSFIVSQVNPHFTPFIQDPSSFKGGQRLFSLILHHLWNYVALDVRNRYARLLLLSLVPKIKGQDVSPFLMQSAEGHITIVPASPSDFWRLTSNPEPQDVAKGLRLGQRKTWPYLKSIAHILKVENKLRELWQSQNAQIRRRRKSGDVLTPAGTPRLMPMRKAHSKDRLSIPQRSIRY